MVSMSATSLFVIGVDAVAVGTEDFTLIYLRLDFLPLAGPVGCNVERLLSGIKVIEFQNCWV